MNSFHLALATWLTLFLSSCSKVDDLKPPEEVHQSPKIEVKPFITKTYGSLTEGPWKLVKSDDPATKATENPYYRMTFLNDFTGILEKVIIGNNGQQGIVLDSFQFDLLTPNGKSGHLRVHYEDFDQTIEYEYELGEKLILRRASKNYTYEFTAE